MERSDSYFPNLIYKGSVISSSTNISAFIFCKYPTGTSYVAKLTQLNVFPSNSFVFPITQRVSIELLYQISLFFSLSKYISNLPSKFRGHCIESNIYILPVVLNVNSRQLGSSLSLHMKILERSTVLIDFFYLLFLQNIFRSKSPQ